MAEQSGPSVDAIQAKQAALSARHDTVADADRVLADTVLGAHAATVATRDRLDAIAAEIDDCVQNQAAFAVATPLGAREFQKFLIAKHRELISIVVEARRDDAARQVLLESLRPQYSGSGELSG
jgi:hypothetical protein